MLKVKNKETIYTIWFYAALHFPIVFLIFLSYFAVREKSLDIFIDFWWIIVLVWILFILAESYSRFIKIDYINKKIFIKDGILNQLNISEGEIKEIDLNHPNIITYMQGGIEKVYKHPFLMFRKKDKRKIINAFTEFNPGLKITKPTNN